MKHLIILSAICFTINISAQTGYRVVVLDSIGNLVDKFDTENYNKVSACYEDCFGFKPNIDKKLEKSFFFHDRTQKYDFYCESMRIVYALNGKKKYKKRKKI